MPTYIVDPVHFHAEGTIVNWPVAARRQGVNPDTGKQLGSVIELRWMLKADRGLPTEPFIVWSRLHSKAPGYQALTLTQQQLLFSGGVTLVTWSQGSVSSVCAGVERRPNASHSTEWRSDASNAASEILEASTTSKSRWLWWSCSPSWERLPMSTSSRTAAPRARTSVSIFGFFHPSSS